MKIGFESTFGVHQAALNIGSARTELIASNLAHTDTPGYKAQDIDFRAAMANYLKSSEPELALQGSQPAHYADHEQNLKPFIQNRPAIHPSVDGNTVDTHLEYVKFGENAERYKASLAFLTDSIQTLFSAIKGGS